MAVKSLLDLYKFNLKVRKVTAIIIGLISVGALIVACIIYPELWQFRLFYIGLSVLYFIIQARKLACKGFRTQFFNRNAFFDRKTRATTSQ